jgi:hypothetical protein
VGKWFFPILLANRNCDVLELRLGFQNDFKGWPTASVLENI